MSAKTVEEEALELPAQERAKLAERLLASLDELPERDVETLWLRVAEHRAREIDDGSVGLVSPDELERRVQARLNEVPAPPRGGTGA